MWKFCKELFSYLLSMALQWRNSAMFYFPQYIITLNKNMLLLQIGPAYYADTNYKLHGLHVPTSYFQYINGLFLQTLSNSRDGISTIRKLSIGWKWQFSVWGLLKGGVTTRMVCKQRDN